MSIHDASHAASHGHVFLGEGHRGSERRTWAVIWLCGVMMVAEIAGGLFFGSIALVADGLHMSTHAGALLLAALAYTYARRHSQDPRFTFGTGKFGDLAGFSSAIILAMIAILIGYESVSRFFAPVAIDFKEAIPIACLGLLVNVASAWLLSGDDHHYGHAHGHSHAGHGHSQAGHGHSQAGHGHSHAGHIHDDEHDHEERHRFTTSMGDLTLEIFEDGVPPRFRLHAVGGALDPRLRAVVETARSDGARRTFAMTGSGDHLESTDTIPEPHAFEASVMIGSEVHTVSFKEHGDAHGAAFRSRSTATPMARHRSTATTTCAPR